MAAKKSTKDLRCDSHEFTEKVINSLSHSWESPIPLSPLEQQIFDEAIYSLPDDTWDKARVRLAANYARFVAESYDLMEQYQREGPTVDAKQGPKVNPTRTALNTCMQNVRQLAMLIGINAGMRMPKNDRTKIKRDTQVKRQFEQAQQSSLLS